MKSKVDYLTYVSSPHSITNYQRVLYYIEVCDSEGRTRFPRPRDAALHLLCKDPGRDDDDEVIENLTYFHCANDTCVRCPNYKISEAELKLDVYDGVFQYASSIKFHTYEKVTRLSNHGSLNDGSTTFHFVYEYEGNMHTRYYLVKKYHWTSF